MTPKARMPASSSAPAATSSPRRRGGGGRGADAAAAPAARVELRILREHRARAARCSSAPGSTPISSTSAERASRYASSASDCRRAR